ncbi:glycosyltransferase family 87 protein [Acidicapsa dinghuensis]|uniref:Glycosyltransferase family 87 protein n=1 Tax=Acidicapsa dinghuensis TaxID=2218256 RepID=A0ABW1EK60_9BACT|nr:glycosyltransferase family 87 protein [Acidicapsa dinghuensis]
MNIATMRVGTILRAIAILVITLAGVAIIAAAGSHATSNDYVEYWSSATLLLQQANPYSSAGVLALEQAHGFLLNSPLIMLNPPWSLPLIAWLGIFSERMGLNLWVLFLGSCIAASIVLLDIPKQHRIVAFLFAPVLANFLMMQISPLLLLGWALFLRYRESRPFWSGVALALLTIKPHLFVLLWAVLLMHSIYKRSIAVLLGCFSATVTAAAAVTLMRPNIWRDYLNLISNSTLTKNNFPTLPTLLRASIHVQWVWLALVPMTIATVWALAYYWKNRVEWDWARQGTLILLLSIATSPYSWLSDQVVLLPAIMVAFDPTPRRFVIKSLVILNIVALILICANWRITIVLPLAWLVWYIFATRKKIDGDQQWFRNDAPTAS